MKKWKSDRMKKRKHRVNTNEKKVGVAITKVRQSSSSEQIILSGVKKTIS